MPLTPQQYLKQQQRASYISSGLGGVAGLLGQGQSMLNEANNINTNAPQSQKDYLGRPLYNLGNFTAEVSAINPQESTTGERLSGALTGASAGAILGPVGALLGGGIGALSTTLFGKRRKKLQDKKRRVAQGNLFSAQQLYNTSIESFNQNQGAMEDYNNSFDENSRLQNLYSFNG